MPKVAEVIMSSSPSDNKPDKIYRTTATKEYGLSDKQLDALPFETVPNPHYRSGPPSRLYLRADVERLVKSLPAGSRQPREERSAAAKTAAKQRAEELIQQAELLEIVVRVVAEEQVVRDACANYNSAERRERDENDASEHSDPDFLDRITVNYIRHDLTEYENCLADVKGKPGENEAHRIIRERVLDEIADNYPWLAGECSRQISKLYSQAS